MRDHPAILEKLGLLAEVDNTSLVLYEDTAGIYHNSDRCKSIKITTTKKTLLLHQVYKNICLCRPNTQMQNILWVDRFTDELTRLEEYKIEGKGIEKAHSIVTRKKALESFLDETTMSAPTPTMESARLKMRAETEVEAFELRKVLRSRHMQLTAKKLTF